MTRVRSFARVLVLAWAPLALVSCAGTLVPERTSMPAARASLKPEYRIFYDSLADYGDWVLIEPFGYVFRPRVNPVAWQPYSDGFWVPTDLYGWVWVSSEPFGWATYHYGRWSYDRFQGWVWVPGAQWGPAWVSWRTNDTYAGWAPLELEGPGSGPPPGGGFTYVPLSQLGSTDLASKRVDATTLGTRIADSKPVHNVDTVEGVRFNRGPSFEDIERVAGPIEHVSLVDLVRPGDIAHKKSADADSPGPDDLGAEPGPPAAAPAATPHAPRPIVPADSTRRAGDAATREAKTIRARGYVPPSVSLVRPFGVSAPPEEAAPAPAAKHAAGKKTAAADTLLDSPPPHSKR